MSESGGEKDGVQKLNRPHALAIALPVQGHINPMMQLARRLASKGCIVTLVNLQSNHEKLLPLLHQVSNGLEDRMRFESIPDRVSVPVASLDIFSSLENRRIFRQAYEAMEKDVVDLLINKLLKSTSTPVTFLLGDVYLNWPGTVADSFKLPKVLFSTTCASSLLVDYYIPRLLETEDIPIDTDTVNLDKSVTANLTGLPTPLRLADLPTYFEKDMATDGGFVNRLAKAKSMADFDWVLINSSDLLEPQAFEALRSQVNKNVLGIGPLLDDGSKQSSDAAWKADRECLNWLNTKAPGSVLYISFGSLATMPPQQFMELAQGLEQSDCSFLWVVRPNLLVHHDEASKRVQESAWELTKKLEDENRVCIVAWAPQLEVLAHSSVGGFLTHCGWNSVLEAVWFGVPVLGWPQLVEQNLVCRIACGEWKAGVSLNRSSRKLIDRATICESINTLMTSGEFRSNCRELQKAVRSSKSAELDTFIQSIMLCSRD